LPTFNLAKKRGNVPPEMAQEAALHKSRLQRREQSLQEDARRTALMMTQLGIKTPKDMMGKLMEDEQYWQYVRRHDPGYMRDVMNLASKIGREIRKNPSKFIPVVPPPKQQDQGGAGGGAGLSLGASSGKTEKVAAWARTHDKDVAWDILSGVQHYMRRDGASYRLVGAEGADQAGRAADRARREMPGKVAEAMKGFLSENGVHDPHEAARALAARAWENHHFDLRPVSVAIGGILPGFLMGANGGREPAAMLELRRRIGAAMEPYVNALRAAAEADGHNVREVQAMMPAYTMHGREQRKKKRSHPDRVMVSGNPKVLSPDEASSSADVRSLLMTIAAKGSKARAEASDRLVFLMCRDPSLFGPHGLDEHDFLVLQRSAGCPSDDLSCDRVRRLVSFSRLLVADDADLMGAYADATDEDKEDISYIVSTQDRANIAEAVPELALPGSGPVINKALFEKLSPKDAESRAIILRALRIHRAGDLKNSEDAVCRKVMEVVIETGDEDLVREALHGPYRLQCFAVSYMLESGHDGAMKAMSMLPTARTGFDQWARTLACASACKHGKGDQALLRLARRTFDVAPQDLLPLVGMECARAYMAASHVDWDGDHVPRPAETYSLPDDPLPLAKKIAALGDKLEMMALLSMAEPGSKAARVLEAGIAGRREWPDETSGCQKTAEVLPDGTVMTGSGGVYSAGGKCFAASGNDATRVATWLLIKEARDSGSN
jgi:hypothetical protein